MELSTAEEFLLASCMTLSLIDLGETSALDVASHCKIAAQSDSLFSRFLCAKLLFCGLFPKLHMFTRCFLSICCGCHQHKAEVPAGMMEESPQKESPPSTSLWCPTSPMSTFLGMWCVAMEMTLAIHVYNDLKQFTVQLRSIL